MEAKIIFVVVCLTVSAGHAGRINAPEGAIGHEAADPTSTARACTNGVCNSFCRSRGYLWGQCVSSNICRCYWIGRDENGEGVEYKFEDIEKTTKEDFVPVKTLEEDTNLEPAVSARACTNNVCNSFCRSRGYLWGQCVSSNICRCYWIGRDQNEEGVEYKFDDITATARACTNGVCNSFCRSRGYLWGQCVSSNICRCYWIGRDQNEEGVEYKFDDIQKSDVVESDTRKILEEDNSATARACTNGVCNSFCRSRGYLWGQCVSSNICRCYWIGRDDNNQVEFKFDDIEKTNEEDFKSVTILEDESNSEPAASARACTNNVCNSFCRSRGYLWGQCVSSNICRCYWIGRDENDNGVEYKFDDIEKNDGADFNIGKILEKDNSGPAVALATARACTNGVCNSFCRSRGYLWGQCVSSNICRCYWIGRDEHE